MKRDAYRAQVTRAFGVFPVVALLGPRQCGKTTLARDYRDIPNLGINIPPVQLRRFWMMLAHYHGNLLNASELGRSLGVSHNTIHYYIDILTGTFMIRELQPWFENISKRQIKSPI